MARLVLGVAALVCSALWHESALAFQAVGHHFLPAALLAELQGATPKDPEWVVELFCAQLPDLSEELDALTQRAHEAGSPKDWLWVPFGVCTSPTCSHMVATHYYLHALTGSETNRVRNSAVALRRRLTDMLAALPPGAAQDRINLRCARGFALHLFGDTFAHSQLGKPGTQYAPGLGHGKDGSRPDYVLQRDDGQANSMREWRAAAALELTHEGPGPTLTTVEQSVRADHPHNDDCQESKMHDALRKLVGAWSPFTPSLRDWTRPPGAPDVCSLSGSAKEVEANKELLAAFLDDSKTCDVQTGRAFPEIPAAPGKAAIRMRPDCGKVWSLYLSQAAVVFKSLGLEQAECDCDKDKLEFGRHLLN